MRRYLSLPKLMLAMMVLIVPAFTTTTASATPSCGEEYYQTWGSLEKASPAGYSNGDVTGLRIGRSYCWDRIVIDIDGNAPGYAVRYTDAVTAPGSGDEVPVGGGAQLEVFVNAPTYDDNGNATLTTAEVDSLNPDWQTLKDVVLAGSFEGQTTFGIGVRARLPFRVFTLAGPGSGSRLVIDFGHFWPAEPITDLDPDSTYARPGLSIGVVGVPYNDRLNVRSGSSTANTVVASLPPMGTAVLTGRAQRSSNVIWYELTTPGGVTGWSSSRYLAYLGGTDDATAEYRNGGGSTEAESFDALATSVVNFFASPDGPKSRIRVVEAPSSGDLHEVTYDIIGIGDDAVAGYRLHIFADSSEGTYQLRSIERQFLCSRGLSPNGLCP